MSDWQQEWSMKCFQSGLFDPEILIRLAMLEAIFPQGMAALERIRHASDKIVKLADSNVKAIEEVLEVIKGWKPVEPNQKEVTPSK